MSLRQPRGQRTQEGGGGQAQDAASGITDTVKNLADQTSDAVYDAVDRGREYARNNIKQYPEINRQIRDTSEPLIRTIKEQPVLCVVIAAGAGLLLGMRISGPTGPL